MVRFLTIFFSLFIANQVNAAPAARAVMENIPTISSINASGFFGPLVGNVVGNLDGTATSATSALSVPTGGVNLSTVTAALAGKVDINTPAQVNLSTVTTALALKVDKNSPDQVNLSTVTTALATKVDKNTPEQVNLSTVTTAIALKASLAGATFTGASGITNQSFTATGPNGNIISGASVTASGFFGNGSGLTGVAKGVNTDIQYNNGGELAGASGFFVWNNGNRYLGVGGTPAATLHVFGADSGTISTLMRTQKGTYGSGYLRQSYTDAGNWGWVLNGDESSSPQFKFDFANGRLGIAKDNPSATLDVNGISVFGSGGTRSTFTATGALDISPGHHITLAGGSRLNGGGATLTYGLTAATGSFTGIGATFAGSQSFAVPPSGYSRIYGLSGQGLTLQGETGSTNGISMLESAGNFYYLIAGAAHLFLQPTYGKNVGIGYAAGAPVPQKLSVVGRTLTDDLTVTYGLTAATGSFSGSVTASSVTALSGGMRLSTIGDKVTFDNARRWIKIDSAGPNPMTFSQHVGAGSGFLFGLDNDDAGADSLTTLVNMTPTGTGIGTASPATTLDVNGNAQFGSGATKSTFTAAGDLTVGGKIGAGGVVGGAGFSLRVEGGAQFNEAGDATNFLQLQASGDSTYYDSYGTAANSGGHVFRVSDASKVALTLDATGGAAVYTRTKAQLLTISAPIGALYYCSDCSDPTSGKPTVVIATGTSAGNFGTLPVGVFQ